MSAVDPTTGQPLPANAIQRILFIGTKVHVYQIPPLTSTKGYTAATWTEDPKWHIFTARLRVLETGTESDTGDDEDDGDSTENVKVDVILEDPSSGQLFAAAPYTEPGVIEPALDSSRFFAVRVQDGQGRRAVLGIGFEERPDAFDFGVALQEARKTVVGFAEQQQQQQGAGGGGGGTSSSFSLGGGGGSGGAQYKTAGGGGADDAEKRDYSLKDGETITINLGGSSKFGRRSESDNTAASSSTGSLSGFSLPPPPSSASSSHASSSSSSASASPFSLPPPPPPSRRTANRRSVGDPSVLGLGSQSQQQQPQQPQQQPQQQQEQHKKSAAELGFDDGQFGEFA